MENQKNQEEKRKKETDDLQSLMNKTIEIISELNLRSEIYQNEVSSSITSMKSVYKNLAEMQMKNLNGLNPEEMDSESQAIILK